MQSNKKKSKDRGYLVHLLNLYQKKRLHVDECGDVYYVDTGGPLAERTKIFSIEKPKYKKSKDNCVVDLLN